MGKLSQVSQPYAPGGTPAYTTYAYDGMGRTLSVTLPDGSVTRYSYDDLAASANTSDVTTTDPASKVKRFQLNGLGQLTQVIEDPSGLAYSTLYTYDALGHLYTVKQTRGGTTQTRTFNSVITSESRTYNNLGQLTGISAGSVSLTYNYTTGQDNGKIASQYNAISGETVQYVYDSLNRLGSATGSNWGNGYVYDGFGNLLQKNVTKGSAPTLTQTVNAATNHITGRSYDGNGNDVTGSYVNYDFLNRMTMYQGTYLNEYAYDASNRRIYKAAYSGSTLQSEGYILYGLDGENLGTYTPTIFNNGSGQAGVLLTQATGRTYFFGKKLFTTEDDVGSAVSNGTFFPYGEQRTGSSSEQYGFATYWQDGESGLNYAMNRHYSNTLGRFLSVDPTNRSMDPQEPQSWNRYVYVGNDPVNLNDPDGMDNGDAGCVINGITYGLCPFGGSAQAPTGWQSAKDFIALFVVVATQMISGMPGDSKCEGDINALGAMSAVTPGADDVDDFDLIEAILDMNPKNWATATAPASTLNDPRIGNIPSVANAPISNLLNNATSPSQEGAVAQLGGNTVYFNPSYIPHGLSSLSAGAGLVTHEALHNMGLDDPEIEAALGLTSQQCGSGSDCITVKLDDDCFSSVNARLEGGTL